MSELTAEKSTDAARLEVTFVGAEAYEVAVRGHQVRVDQPVGVGSGEDSAPTPTELFVASLATCVAFYAGRYLTRHGYSRDGLGVAVEYQMAQDKPARVAQVRLLLRVPDELPEQRRPALLAVASHCTVHNSITTAPAVAIDIE